MKKLRWSLAILALGIAYLLFWPIRVMPVPWQASPSPGYVGVHAPNTRLAALQFIDLGDAEGPEHVAAGPDGNLYVAVAGGDILRMAPDGSRRGIYANTGGRVLGFDFDADGRLIAADAIKGLVAVGTDRRVTVLVQQVAQGDPIRYADAVIVAADGTVYFTDATTRFSPADEGGTFMASVLDILEQSATGRVLAYTPSTGRTRVVAQGLSFANGIALSADGRSLLVVETGRYRVWSIDVAAADLDVRRPDTKAHVLLDNLPGFPDNLMRGRDGRIWVGLAKPRNALADRLAGHPFVRRIVLRLPRFLWPIPEPYGHIVAFTDDGRIVDDLQDPSGAYPETTGATQLPGRLYVQSLHAKKLGWLPFD